MAIPNSKRFLERGASQQAGRRRAGVPACRCPRLPAAFRSPRARREFGLRRSSAHELRAGCPPNRQAGSLPYGFHCCTHAANLLFSARRSKSEGQASRALPLASDQMRLLWRCNAGVGRPLPSPDHSAGRRMVRPGRSRSPNRKQCFACGKSRAPSAHVGELLNK